jgi:hypothetical protein
MKNVYKGWKTTTIGLLIIAAAATSVFFDKSWLDASIGIGIGLGLVFSPDIIIDNVLKLFRSGQDNV